MNNSLIEPSSANRIYSQNRKKKIKRLICNINRCWVQLVIWIRMFFLEPNSTYMQTINIPFISILSCWFGFSVFSTKSNKMKKYSLIFHPCQKKNIQQNVYSKFQHSKKSEYFEERECEVETLETEPNVVFNRQTHTHMSLVCDLLPVTTEFSLSTCC